MNLSDAKLSKQWQSTQKSTLSFTIYMFEEVSSINHEWRNSSTSKPSKLVTVTGCRESMGKWHHDMPQHSAILRSPSHTPGLGTLSANLVFSQIDVRDGRVCLQRLGQGLETETDQGWRLNPGLYRSNRDHWNPGEHMTFNSDMWISLIQNLANNAESDSCWQHLHIWQLSLRWKMNDETTGPPNHPNLSLSKDVENIWKQKHSAVGSTIKTWSLKSWEQIHLTQTCESLWCET